MAETLSGVNVGEMDLDDPRIRALDRVGESNRGVAIGAGVENDGFARTAGVLHPGDEIAFLVRLAEVQSDSMRFAGFGQTCLDHGECFVPVNRRFARAEKIEIWPIENVD